MWINVSKDSFQKKKITFAVFDGCLSSHSDELLECLLLYSIPFYVLLYASVNSLLEAQEFILWTEPL